jgi:hypothetical protein
VPPSRDGFSGSEVFNILLGEAALTGENIREILLEKKII